ncbi:MAG: hypothetical protein ACRBDI_04650 [Alphaproteobacteria bacterium]
MASKKNKISSRIFLNLIATIFLAAVGIWGSHSIDKILQNPLSDNIEVWGFYILTICFVIFFTWLLYSRETYSLSAQKELIEKSDELEEIIRTLPPEGFLDLFSEKYDEAHGVYKALLASDGQVTKQDIELSIRGILLGILRLTTYFDRAAEDHSYGANIMIFTDAYKEDKTFKPDLRENLKFVNDDVDLNKLKGLIYLKHELSTNSKEDDSSMDDDLQKILLALPVPNEAKSADTQKFRALPGAPLAIALNKSNVYANTETLDEWVRTQGDFNKTIETQIKEYFCSGIGQEIKSFCSFPLSCDDGEPIAVLNIHKNAINILSGKDQFAMYIKIMCPFLSMLSELVNKLSDVKNK